MSPLDQIPTSVIANDAIAHWNAQTPLLLLPIRLEVRFKRVNDQRTPDRVTARDELWVRIYPDDCVIDNFEPELSDTEWRSAARYWAETWAADENDGLKRAAWRSLVASHGAGRAAWIVSQARPAGAPPKKPTHAVLLVIPGAAAPAALRDQVATYWVAVWRANGERAALDSARDELAQALDRDPSELIAATTPVNLSAAAPAEATRKEVRVVTAWMDLAEPVSLKRRSATQASKVHVLPDRFVVIGYQRDVVVFEGVTAAIASPLTVSADFSSKTQFRHTPEGDLDLPPELSWLTDFESACAAGMGLKIPLDPTRVDLSVPIDRVIALGLRLSADADAGGQMLDDLIAHHRLSRPGFALLPQGAPTNNTDTDAAAFARGQDEAAAYDANAQGSFAPADWWSRRDGEWLADALGLPRTSFERVEGAHRLDFAEARAMNRALWPATLGYTLETMLAPALSLEDARAARWFYTRFVTGRGFLPTVRVGNQPYGVLAVSALSKWTWLDDGDAPVGADAPEGAARFLSQLARVLATMRQDWRRMAERAGHLSAGSDAHQALLDVIGLHPASVEFHARYAESLEHLYNLARLNGTNTSVADLAADLGEPALLLLRKLGYSKPETPEALSRFFAEHATRLNGPLVDDVPLMEDRAIRGYSLDGKNYLEWLTHTARHAFEDLRQERGFAGDAPPRALLYILVRHALLLGYWDTAVGRLETAGENGGASAALDRQQPAMIHVAEGSGSESRYTALYSDNPAATGGAANVAEAIAAALAADTATGALADQLAALDLLTGVPTARLERCLAEHFDTASHRLDAWLLGLVHYQLSLQRYRRDASPAGGGLYVGAVGWLEQLQPRPALSPLALDDDLRRVFGDQPIARDPINGGHLLAPSLIHAKTAAILRAGSVAAGDANEALAVDLSSARVRAALGMIEGLRNGQPLGALLGYRLQRRLHELRLDHVVAPLRARFPLVANQMTSTKVEGVPIEAIEAENVIDGRKLVETLREADVTAFALSLDATPPVTTDAATTIAGEIGQLFDVLDALADLALAEGVHQAVRGNYDRVASTLDAYAKGTFPPEPDVVRTPRSGVSLTHRVGLHFEVGVAYDEVPWTSGTPTPRSMAQPMMNKWLASIFPAPEKICGRLSWDNDEAIVTAADLGIQPIDLLYIGALDGETTLRELDDRLLQRVVTTRRPPADAELAVDHLHRFADDRVSFFELGALIQHLRTLLLSARPLAATDLAPADTVPAARLASATIDPARVLTARGQLAALGQKLRAFRNAPPATIDNAITDGAQLLADASLFGLQQGWGFLYVEHRLCYSAARDALKGVVDRWTARRTEFTTRMQDYAAQAGTLSDGERRAALVRMDILIAATPTTPPPATNAGYVTTLQGKTAQFDAKLTELETLLTQPPAGLHAFLRELDVVVTQGVPLDRFDTEPLDVKIHRQTASRLTHTLLSRVGTLAADLDARIAAVDTALVDGQVEALQRGGAALLGNDVRLIPELTFTSAQNTELSAAYQRSGDLLRHASTVLGGSTIDHWLNGIARVRNSMYALEQAALYAQALAPQGSELGLTPIQLPFRQGESWLALEFDPATPPTGERLLYTAHYAGGTNAASACGLLIDEWTEVIPANDETAGLTFHYDRPGSEPPQVWLLVTAPRLNGVWNWSDVLGALDETFDLIRLRAVEPQHVEATPYARFLPATTSAAALTDISISLNLARVNDYATHPGDNRHG